MSAQDGSVENLTRGNDDSARKMSFHYSGFGDFLERPHLAFPSNTCTHKKQEQSMVLISLCNLQTLLKKPWRILIWTKWRKTKRGRSQG